VFVAAGMLTKPQGTRPRLQQYCQGQTKAKTTALKAKAKANTKCMAYFKKCFLNFKLTLWIL